MAHLLKSISFLETRLADKGGIDSWFKKLSPEMQKEYVKHHPNSKFAPSGKSNGDGDEDYDSRRDFAQKNLAPKPKSKPRFETPARTMKDVEGPDPDEKDHQRLKDIVTKGKGDNGKMMQLVNQMAKSITDKDKALRRGESAYQHLPKEIRSEARRVFHDKADSL